MVTVDVAIAFEVSENGTKALVVDAEGLAEGGSGERFVGLPECLEHVG